MCGQAISAQAKVDHFGKRGRIRGEVLLYAVEPANLRMDVVSPFGVAVATLTSDGNRFAMFDLREKKFFVGPAAPCNIARLTGVSIPGHAFVELLRGQAPLLKHAPDAPTIAWSGRGYYVVQIPSTRNATEEIHLTPHPQDWARPWSEQRMRLVGVEVRQSGELLYRAELDEHEAAPMAKERIDPDGLEPPLPPSGPECHEEVPRRIRVEVPPDDTDVRYRTTEVAWNPPLPDGLFTQEAPPGTAIVPVRCEDGR